MAGSFGAWRQKGKLIPADPIGQTSHYCNLVRELVARVFGLYLI